MKLRNVLLLIIIIVAAFIRIYKLGSIPPHLSPDEASLGYNAYSIMKTGKDEYGSLLPLIFKSFGDYKPGFYVYLTVPFVYFLGLNEWAVRLPSAIAGVVAVWLVYLLVNALRSIKESDLENSGWILETLVALVLALSPWHIHFSRGAWEANVSLTMTLLGLLFFIKSLKIYKYLIPSALFFSLTFLTYQGAKLSTTIVVIIIIVTFINETKKLLLSRKVIITSFVIAVIISIPIFLSVFRGQVGRLRIFSVFSYPRPEEYLETFLDQGNENVGSLSYYLYHSETLNFARGVMGRYFNHFSGKFLFFEGDYQNPKHISPHQGMLLFIDIMLLPIGMLMLVKNKSRFMYFTFLFLFISPIPAALSRDQVNAVRALNMVVPLAFITGYGLYSVAGFIKRSERILFKVVLSLFIIVGFLTSEVYFIDSYFVHLPKSGQKYWNYGYKQIVEKVYPIRNEYKKIKIQQSFAQPYIYYLFFTKYDPFEYQKSAQLVESEYKYDVGYVEKIENIYFAHMDFPQDKKEGNTLIIADTIVIPNRELNNNTVSLFDEIKYANGDVAFRIVEIK